MEQIDQAMLEQVLPAINAHRKHPLSYRWEDADDIADQIFGRNDIVNPQTGNADADWVKHQAAQLMSWHRDKVCERINKHLEDQKQSLRLQSIDMQISGGSFVRHFTAKSKRGALLHITLEYSHGVIGLKSINRIVNKRSRWTYLINGQAGTNQTGLYFYGPAVIL